MSTAANTLLFIKYLEEITENTEEYMKRGFSIYDDKLNQGYLEVYYLNTKYKVRIVRESGIYYWKVLNSNMEKIYVTESQVDNSFEKVLKVIEQRHNNIKEKQHSTK